ncbi:AAA family ATPase [Mixta sp. Marseille-Q2659]|uniref:trifunctional serine/threonine-protein kinase/ATP-binding protein/sensor histidine kinase n=1 Tax=Mixta sp. Marseille-Q2659 TaxID=2736607 RepID=UPI0023BA1F19|nr:AAA family ATPase [Mixta sp. Marseille-Q2659]
MSEKLSAAGQMMDAGVLTLSDEIIFTPLAQEGAIAWTLGQPLHSGESFILASAAGEERAFQATQLLKHEFSLRMQLSADWAVRPLSATLHHSRYALVYAAFPFQTLTRLMPLNIADFLALAVRLCKPLQQMHAAGLIHNDIKPGNIFLDADGGCRLGGFGLACAVENGGAQTRLNVSGGTLAYMSPEHTARTRDAVDSRSDLYSLGIVLYELLTGALPFDLREGGQAEWAHHHIASAPRPPHQLRAEILAMLSVIILRLLEKSPGNRYQSVEGLIADLRRCQANLADDGQIADFTPGLQDRAPVRWLTDNLYLHHPQEGQLLAAFARVATASTPELVVISGPQGIGKSSLIASALKSIQHKPALLAVSKADQYSPVLPYAVITAAFRALTLYLLGLDAAEVAYWKRRLSRALGNYAGLAVNLVPELGLLLDSKAQLPADMHSADARLRFNQMAHGLVRAFATPGRPLVLLIDDIHWIDQASLQLLAYLASNCEALPLLIVVSYCDAENEAQSPLATLRASTCGRQEIRPQPFSVKAVARWLADIFQTRAAGLNELAALIHEKTGGNPLFTYEFFRRIVQDGLITHHPQHGKWHYDLAAIRARNYTENVATLLLQRLAALPPSTRQLLGGLASVGGNGKLALLSQMQGIPLAELREQLQPAIDARLIAFAADEYAFTHDRLQKAAQALLAPEEACRLNFAAASQLTDALSQNDNNDALFLAVHHITSAIDSIRAPADRERFRTVCLRAAQRAKSTGDYASTLRYLGTARSLQPEAQHNAPDEIFALDFQQAECEFLQGNLPTALTLCNQLMTMPGSREQKALAACMMAEVHMRQSDMQLALETALAWLAVFGIHLSRRPDDKDCLEARRSLEARIGAHPSDIFSALPVTDDREAEAIMSLLIGAGMFAAFASPRLHFLLLCKILEMTLDRGMCGASTAALSWYGVLIGCRYDDYPLGLQYSLLGRDLVMQHAFDSFKGRTLLAVDLSSAWVQPLNFVVEQAKNCFTVAVDHGDLTAACFIIRHQTMNFLTRGDHLDAVLTTIERGLSFIRKLRFPDVEILLLIQRLYVTHLRNPSAAQFSGAGVLPDSLIAPENGRQPIPLTRFWFWLYRGMAYLLAGEYQQASDALAEAGELTYAVPGYVHLLDYHFYSALALTLPLSPENAGAAQRQQAQAHYAKIALWAEHNPATFADKAALIAAELARLAGDNGRASEQYERAIKLSGEAEFHHVNGLAHELAGRFAKACGYHVASDAYFKGAFSAWRRWGALAKLRQLEQQWPHLAPSGQSTPYDTIAFAQNEAIRDLESVLRAVRAMTEEINLDRLIHILMTMLLERAGAQRGLLIRILDNNIPETQAWAETTSDGVKVQIVKETPSATDLPLSVLAAVMRTGQEIRTSKPEVFSPFSQDAYLVTSGAAVMCVPMYKQAQMVGVLYLENRLMPDIFTAEHSRIVRMLAAQAAVSLETARLYAELLEENIQRRRVEKELRASQTSLMLGEKISNTGTWRWELEHDLMFVSDEYARILDLPEGQRTISMADFLQLVHREDFPRINKLVTESVRNGVSMRAEFRIFRPDGSCRYILGVGNPIGEGRHIDEYFGTITDVTARRQSEDAVRVAQADLARVSRATTVGQLTASIAHEINQPLMSIVANAGASLRWLSRNPVMLTNARSSLEEIISEGERAGNIIRGLQALTRNQMPSYARVNLHHLVYHIMALSRSELERRQIVLEYALKAEAAFIYGDSVQIQQVLLNLVMNAIDAMSEIHHRPRVLTLNSFNPTPEKIRLEIADTGIGLCPEVKARLFDSFYTTKEQGMGMGLTISYGIIEKHLGELTAESRQPDGSVFAFTLPIDREQQEASR